MTVSIDEATKQFAALAELALSGETVFIEGESGVLVLWEYFAPEPIPPGALEGVYSEEEIREDNLFAKRASGPFSL